MQMVKLFALSGKQIWPPVVKRDLSHFIPVIEAPYGGPDWWKKEIQEARQAQVKADSDRLTEYYAQQQRLKEERERQEESWKQVGGAGK